MVFASGTERVDAENRVVHMPFSINSQKEDIVLYDPHSREISRVEVRDLPDNTTCGPDAEGKTVYFKQPTPGAANAETYTPAVRGDGVAAADAKVRLNEYATKGSVTLAEFVMLVVLSFGMLTPLIGIMSYSDDIGKISVIVGEINSILQKPELVRPKDKVKMTDYTVKGENVRFGYDEGKEILHGVNFEFRQGTVNALVGPSGSGKSTIAKLIASMWDVGNGKITIGGRDIREIPLEQLNQNIAYVAQDNFLFNESVRENIRKGNLAATDEEVENIAKASGCHEFIMKLENGYDTVVGERGVTLSGGQKQRVAIARMLLQDTPVLIFDDSLSAVDAETDAAIRDALHSRRHGTMFLISHRIATIRKSDLILVLDKGRVVQMGTHDTLAAQEGLYRRVCAIQNELPQAASPKGGEA